MKNLVQVAAAAALGAIAMYYLDATMGRRRRALATDKVVGASHDIADVAEAKGKRFIDRAKGVFAARSISGMTSTEPATDAQLHDRIRAQLGRLTGHPRAIEVSVSDGTVRLSGDVLARELDTVLSGVRHVTGVKMVHNALTAHDHAGDFPALQGEPREERTTQPS
jgi:osmotically-inducible protein OsmY